MQFLKQYTLNYTPLSPVHIGADESYEPGNYVIDDDNGALYSFDSQAAFAGLNKSDRSQLLGIVNGKPNDEMLTKVQAFFHHNREKLMGLAQNPVPIARGVASLYQKRIGKAAQHENRHKRVINKLEIERTFYNPVNNQPLFPGSSIKGAIRTALLDQLNDGKGALSRERSQDLQKRIFEGSFHTDPFRLISLSDAHWQGQQVLPSTQVQFAVNRKREQVMKEGKELQSQAERKNLYQLLECIPAQESPALQGSLQIQDVSQIKQHDKKLPKHTNQWDIKDIAQACNAFYVVLLQNELAKLKQRHYLHAVWVEKIEALLAQGLYKRMDKGDVFLLKLGRHSGAEAVTLNGARSIKIMQGRGNKPVFEKQAKTWWLAADDINAKTNMLPFGWVLVEIDAKHDTKPVSHSLAHNELAQWYQQQQQKQAVLKEHIIAQAAIEQAKREQDILAEQQRQEEQLIEQQRLASLSPLDQELETFLNNIQKQEHDTRLLKELNEGHWQGGDAKKVAEKIKRLMQQSNKWLPDFAGSNKKKMKLKERSLQVQAYLNT